MSAAFPKASKRASQRRAAIQSACLHQHRPNEGSAGPNPIYEGFTWLTDLLPRGNQPTNIFILINLQVLQVENICLPSPFFYLTFFPFFSLSLSLFLAPYLGRLLSTLFSFTSSFPSCFLTLFCPFPSSSLLFPLYSPFYSSFRFRIRRALQSIWTSDKNSLPIDRRKGLDEIILFQSSTLGRWKMSTLSVVYALLLLKFETCFLTLYDG